MSSDKIVAKCVTEILIYVTCWKISMLKKIRVVFQGKSEALMLSLTEQEMNEMDNLLNRMYTIAEVRNNWYNYSVNIENEIYCTKKLQVILVSVQCILS